jgi:hypothetical protein
VLWIATYWHIMQVVVTSILKVHYESLDEEKKAIFSRAMVQHDANLLQHRVRLEIRNLSARVTEPECAEYSPGRGIQGKRSSLHQFIAI